MKQYIGILAILFFLLTSIVPVSAQVSCGNHSCEPGENSCTCTQDCGSCESYSNQFFDYKCVETICKQLPKSGVCGNNVCEEQFSEDYGNCPQDCEPKTLEIEIISPKPNDSFARNGKGTLEIKITANGRDIPGAQVSAVQPFRNIQLVNTLFSNEYKGEFQIPADIAPNSYDVEISASFRKAIGKTTLPITIEPRLNTTFSVQPKTLLGDTLLISGTIQNGSAPVSTPITIKILDTERKSLFNQTVSSQADGSFQIQFKTSLNDLPGNWLITGNGTDDYNNAISVEGTTTMVTPQSQRQLAITTYLDQNASVSRGTQLTIIAQVTDSNIPTTDANLVLVSPSQQTIPFQLAPDGNYTLFYTIPSNLPFGKNTFHLQATKIGIIPLEGQLPLEITIIPTLFSIQLVKPQTTFFSIGDNVEFRVFAQYESGEPVLDANTSLLVNQLEIPLQAQGGGYYSGNYTAQEQDAGELRLKITSTDGFNQTASADTKLNIYGYGTNYYLTRYGAIGLGALALLIVGYFVAARFATKRFDQTKAKKRAEQIIELEKDLQSKYFEKGSIQKSDYESQMLDYEDELKKIKEQLGRAPK